MQPQTAQSKVNDKPINHKADDLFKEHKTKAAVIRFLHSEEGGSNKIGAIWRFLTNAGYKTSYQHVYNVISQDKEKAAWTSDENGKESDNAVQQQPSTEFQESDMDDSKHEINMPPPSLVLGRSVILIACLLLLVASYHFVFGSLIMAARLGGGAIAAIILVEIMRKEFRSK